MSAQGEFIELYQAHIHREGADALLDYLKKVDIERYRSIVKALNLRK